jgi:hypothetical protein
MGEDIRKMINKVKNFKQFVNENYQVKSTNNFDMFELLKTLPFIKYVDRPSGRFLHSIDLVIVNETNIDDLKEILDKNNWYIERGRDRSFTITQKYVDDAKVEIPKFLYHTTPSKNIESILSNGLKPKSEDLRHKYPPRIYVADNYKSLKNLEKELKRWKGGSEDYSIIKIDTTGLDMELYIDSTSAYKGHYYIQGIDVIPSENVELLK